VNFFGQFVNRCGLSLQTQFLNGQTRFHNRAILPAHRFVQLPILKRHQGIVFIQSRRVSRCGGVEIVLPGLNCSDPSWVSCNRLIFQQLCCRFLKLLNKLRKFLFVLLRCTFTLSAQQYILERRCHFCGVVIGLGNQAAHLIFLYNFLSAIAFKLKQTVHLKGSPNKTCHNNNRHCPANAQGFLN